MQISLLILAFIVYIIVNMNSFTGKVLTFFLCLPIVFLFSCKTTSFSDDPKNLTLVFAGDIMAHENNYKTDDYNLIFEDISQLLHESDLAFANIESPVCKDLPFESYPTFNMQPSYPEAAIKAGFNVLSLSNNHTNDQGLLGINATQDWANKVMKETSTSNRSVYFSGLKIKDQYSYNVIKIKDWTVLHISITQILNQNSYSSLINYVPPTEKARTQFVEEMKTLKQNNPCDLFIITINTNEDEYNFSIDSKVESFFKTLLENGVDIISANHPHVVRKINCFGHKGKTSKMIMYANGNVISAQRTRPSFDNPENIRDYTGDGMLVKVVLSKDKRTPVIKDVQIEYITTFIDSKRRFLVKRMNNEFYEELKKENLNNWASYLEQREVLLKSIQGSTIWQ